MISTPGHDFRRAAVKAGAHELRYAEAAPPRWSTTIVSLPGSAGLEMSTAKDRLAREYRVIEINPPGWGECDDLTAPMSLKECAHLLGEAADSVVEGPYVVLGTSMSGVNALYLAAEHPDRVRGIVLEASMAPCRRTDFRVPLTDDLLPAAPDVPDGGSEPPLPPTPPNKPWATPEFIGRQMADRARMFRHVPVQIDSDEGVRAVREHGIPVLVLLGEDDEIIAPSQRDFVAQRIPHARFELVPGGWHDIQNTAPDAFVTAVERFVSSLDA